MEHCQCQAKCSYIIVARSHATDEAKKHFAWRGISGERCLFVDGFIYTCAIGGLAAYELIEEDDSYYVDDGIFLEFSWRMNWERHRMCLEYVGKDTDSGSIVFCVLQGDYFVSVLF